MPEITFNEELHQYLVDGVIKPSVTQILMAMGIKSFNPNISQDVMERARIFGSCVHKFCEIEDKGEQESYEPAPIEVLPCLFAWEQFKEDFNAEIIDIEKWFYNEKGDYCGTIDRRLIIEGKRVVCDIKTSTSFYQSTALQLEAYKNEQDEEAIAVHLSRDGSYKVYGTKKFGKQKKAHINAEQTKRDWEDTLRLYKTYHK